jgi:enoyl-CoA hydratase/carnithine racemase
MSAVEVECDSGYAVITLNRPEKRNAVTMAMAAEFRAALRDLEDTRVVVVTGAGDHAFCAGVDLSERKERATGEEHWTDTRRHFWFESLEAVRRHPGVFVAAVNGFAVGGGLTLVNACELAVAADTASFQMPELNFGSFPSLAAPSTATRVLPKHVAHMVLTRERINSATALAWGIVTEVRPAGEVLTRARELAAAMTEVDPVLLALTKKSLQDLAGMAWFQAIDYGLTTTSLLRRGIRP